MQAALYPNSTGDLPLGVKLVQTKVHGDSRGDLMSIESDIDTPFEIKRVYTLFHTTHHMIRGCHAHIDMDQLIMNVTGSYQLTLDDGKTRTSINFQRPGEGVLLTGPVWRELTHFSPGSVINCFASKHFSDCTYIRDYQEFLSIVAGK